MKFNLKGSFFYSRPWKKAMLLFWLVSFSFLFFYLFSIISAIAIYGIKILDVSYLTNYNSPETLGTLKYMQFLNSLGLFFIPALLMAWVSYGSIKNYFGFNSVRPSYKYILAALIAVSLIPINNFLAELNTSLHFPESMSAFEHSLRASEKSAEVLTYAFIKADGLGMLFINLFIMAVIPAISEEFLFRGALQRIFTEWTKNAHWGIIISAFLFSAVHFQFFTFLPRFVLGIVFGYLLLKTGSIIIPIIAHFVNNAMAVIIHYLIDIKTVSSTTETVGSNDSAIWVIPSFLVSAALFYLIVKKRGITTENGNLNTTL